MQACLVAGLAVPVVWAVSAGAWRNALVLLGVFGAVVVLVVVPLRGRPAARWLAQRASYQFGVVTGWSRWQSRAAAGLPVDPAEPDLPGVLTRLRFPDGPPYRGEGRVCLVHDTAEGRWGATARLVHGGVGLISGDMRELLARRLGTMLRSSGAHGIIDRLSIYVRSVPDDGTEYTVWRECNEAADAPPLALDTTEELSRTVGAVSVRHEIFLAVSGTEEALRKPAQHAGGGLTGRAAVLYRALDGLDDPLKSLGVHSIQWLDGAAVAEAIRTGFNPHAAEVLTAGHLAGTADTHLEWAAAGATHAPPPEPRSYSHDGFTSVSYAVLMPPSGTVFGSLGPLLAIRTAGERRTLAIHYEVLSHAVAARDVRSQRFTAGVLRDLKARRGFARTAADARQASTAGAQEQAVDAGHALVRYAIAASITVPGERSVEDHAARMEADAAGRFRLMRLDLAQDSGFVAACLPVGIGLPRSRGGLL